MALTHIMTLINPPTGFRYHTQRAAVTLRNKSGLAQNVILRTPCLVGHTRPKLLPCSLTKVGRPTCRPNITPASDYKLIRRSWPTHRLPALPTKRIRYSLSGSFQLDSVRRPRPDSKNESDPIQKMNRIRRQLIV